MQVNILFKNIDVIFQTLKYWNRLVDVLKSKPLHAQRYYNVFQFSLSITNGEKVPFSVGMYFFKDSSENTRTMYDISSELGIECQNNIFNVFLVFLLLTLNRLH